MSVVGAAFGRNLSVLLFVFDLIRASMSASAIIVLLCPTTSQKCTYRNLKIDHLVGKGGHLVAEAELVFACLFRSEDIISLPLFLAR